MVNYQEQLSLTFGALADATRRAVVEDLARGEQGVSELAARHSMSLPAFLKHVRLLEVAGLVTSDKLGRVRRCRLEAATLATARDWIETHRAFWEGQLDSLGRYLEETRKEDSTWPRPAKRRTSSRSGGPTPPRPKRSSRRGRPRPR